MKHKMYFYLLLVMISTVAKVSYGSVSPPAAPPCNLEIATPISATLFLTFSATFSFSDSIIHANVQPSPVPSIPPGPYLAWCVDDATPILIDPPGAFYTGELISSQDPNLNSFLP